MARQGAPALGARSQKGWAHHPGKAPVRLLHGTFGHVVRLSEPSLCYCSQTPAKMPHAAMLLAAVQLVSERRVRYAWGPNMLVRLTVLCSWAVEEPSISAKAASCRLPS